MVNYSIGLSHILNIREKYKKIKNINDLDYKVFSFPFTDNGVEGAFYKKINNQLDLTFGTAGIKHDVANINLQRIGMEENKKGIEIIKTQHLYYFFKKFLGKNKISR